MTDLIKQAKEEIARLDEQIDAITERRNKLSEFVYLASQLFVESSTVQDSLPMRVVAKATQEGTRRHGTTRAVVIETALRMIKHKGPTQTKEVLNASELAGATIGSADKLQAVSVILSKSDLFQSDRNIGWTLKNEKPESAPTQSGLSAANAA